MQSCHCDGTSKTRKRQRCHCDGTSDTEYKAVLVIVCISKTNIQKCYCDGTSNTLKLQNCDCDFTFKPKNISLNIFYSET